jgi:hypothetical protein
MKNVLKKGIVLLVIYGVFTAYLFLASERIERLDREDDSEKVNVSIIYGE